MADMDYITQKASENFDGEITAHTTTFYGICKNCLDQKNLQKSS